MFKKSIFLVCFVLLGKSVLAIEALKSVGDDVDNGFLYILLFFVAYVLPLLIGVIFIIIRHVNKNPWYSFGIYLPAFWFVGGHYAFQFWKERIYGSAKSGEFPFWILIVVVFILIHLFFDIEQVKANRSKNDTIHE